MTNAEAIIAAKTLSPTMAKALRRMITVVKEGRAVDGVGPCGANRATLRALRNRGFIRFENMREVKLNTGRGGFYGRTYFETVFTVVWNVNS